MSEETLVLKEGNSKQEVPMLVGSELQKQGICDISLGEDGKFFASNFSRVGLIKVGNTTVEIRPKISVAQVLQLLIGDLSGFKSLDQRAEIETDQSWTVALVEFFLKKTEEALSRGPHHGYVSVSESSRVIRGRIDFSRQAKKSPGILIPIEVDYDEYTPDIPENRILKTAIQIAKSRLTLFSPLRTRILRLDSILKDVSILNSWGNSPHIEFNRLTEHYKPAISLAELIIRFSGIDSRRGDTSATSFLLHMEKIFEKFIGEQFHKLSSQRSFSFSPQGDNMSLDSDGYVRIRPDYLWSNGLETIGLADAKYKHFDNRRQVPNQDVYQMITYCTRYGISDGYLLYASSPDFTIDIEGSPIKVHVRKIDLGANIDTLEHQIRLLQEEILKPPDYLVPESLNNETGLR